MVADGVEEGLHEGGVEVEWGAEDLLDDVKETEGKEDYQEVQEELVGYHDLETDHISHVISDGVDIGVYPVDGPFLLQDLAVDSTPYLSSLSEFFEVIAKSQEIKAHLLEVADFEVIFDE